ncbi:haloacid dehalogenase-like hydrolase, putative [Verrucomicrobiia bacterium DG1235]|nr:haloacid dehalogenase-like hydrolase, putative [Verrucomicrobiae bacterium DG1235]
MQFSQVKAVTFDAAHTIYHPYPSVGQIYREVMQRHGLDYEATELQAGFRRAFRSVSKDKAIVDGERREWSYWKAIVAESISQLDPQPDDFDSLFQELWDEFSHGHRWKPEASARETISELRKKGYQTALLTNWDSRVRNVVDETDFANLFDHLFISSEIGHEKPDPEIFRHCQTALQLEPPEILHIGDSLQHDIQGAQAAGWQTLRITDEPSHQANGYRHIAKLSELLPLL